MDGRIALVVVLMGSQGSQLGPSFIRQPKVLDRPSQNVIKPTPQGGWFSTREMTPFPTMRRVLSQVTFLASSVRQQRTVCRQDEVLPYICVVFLGQDSVRGVTFSTQPKPKLTETFTPKYAMSFWKRLFRSKESQEKEEGDFYEAAKAGDLENVKELLEDNSSLAFSVNRGRCDKNWTPLHAASLHGHSEVVELLLAHKADVNARIGHGLGFSGNEDLTPLHLAAGEGYKDVVKILLAKGANVNAYAIGTPLHSATAEGHMDVVKILLAKGADVNAKGDGGMTPLHIAANKRHYEIAKLLLAKGANVNAKLKHWVQAGTLTDFSGYTPLHFAATRCDKGMVELLLAKGADPKAKDKNGSPPFWIE